MSLVPLIDGWESIIENGCCIRHPAGQPSRGTRSLQHLRRARRESRFP